MVERVRQRGRPRALWLALVPVLLLVLLLLLAPAAALARPSWVHDGASCGTGCHLDTPVVGPDNGECQACHTGFQLEPGGTLDCWSCHQPGASMTAFQQQSGCVGVCHMYNGTDYTNDQTPHGATPHYASTLKNCTVCHGVATGPAAPDGSPHHDGVNFSAPTSASCLTCHDQTNPVDGAPAYHGDLMTGVTATDCQHCHVGMANAHPTATALINPTIKATYKASGTDVVVSGTLKAGTTVLPNFTGWVQWKAPTDTDWSLTNEMAVTTTATGTFTATITAPVAGTVYRVIFEGATVGAKTYAPSLAPALAKTTVTIKLVGVKNGILRLGRSVTVKGVVTPARAAKATVTFQRKVGTKWVKVKAVGRTINATTGAYSYTYKPGKRGAWRVNVKVAATATATAALTPWKTFRVK